MPRPRKKQESEAPLVELERTPNLEDFSKPSIEQTKLNESNVIELPRNNQPIASTRDWSDVDSILSDVVSFI